MARNQRVTTYKSKQVAFDSTLIADLTVDESAYFLVCLTPVQRWFLLTLLEFYTTFDNRFIGSWTRREIDQLHATTLKEVICPLACQEDIQAINTTLQAINTTLLELTERVAPVDTNIHDDLLAIEAELDELTTAITGGSTVDILDQVEALLNGVGVILGAPNIPILP